MPQAPSVSVAVDSKAVGLGGLAGPTAVRRRRRSRRPLPGFRLALGTTLSYLGLLVMLPLAALVVRSAGISVEQFHAIVTSPRAVASYRLSLMSAGVAAAINAVFGFVVAWVLVRYRMPGRRLLDAAVDLPLALPTAVAGIALTAVYSANGWIGQHLEPAGVKVAFAPLGIILALTFVGLPFVVRTVQPVLQDVETELEEAAASLGAGRWHTFRRVTLPSCLPALLTGFTMALARGLGEYGSIVFISGNLPLRTEITTLLIMTKLEQYDYAGATAIATVMLLMSFALLFAINGLQAWSRNRAAN